MKILQLKLDVPPYGTWTFDAILQTTGGEPFPSESEAYVFDNEFIPRAEALLKKLHSEIFHVPQNKEIQSCT